MTKKYILPGYLEYSMVLKCKKGYMRCNFEKGTMSGSGFRAAMFTTDKKEVQELLENTDMFKRGEIKIACVYSEPDYSSESPGPEAEVTTLQQARQYLMDNFEVTLEELQTRAMVKEFAAKKNITFPNWK